MTLDDKFSEPNMQFANLRTGMTPEANFRKPNMHFTSSGTGMIQIT
jgi:hypothetical protein